jgi:hypothetical protein
VQFKLICRANQLNLLHQLNAFDAAKAGTDRPVFSPKAQLWVPERYWW